MSLHALCLLVAAALTTGEIAFTRDKAVRILDTATNEERTVFEIEHDRPLAWSPGGRYLIVWKHSETAWDLWRLDLRDEDDIEEVNLTNAEHAGHHSASFSPDGKRIAFLRDSPIGLWIMNSDGSDMRQLSEAIVLRGSAPHWSPDGRKLLYDTVHGLHLFDLDAEEDKRVAGGSSPQWIADDRILFIALRDGRRAVMMSDLDRSNEQRLSGPAHDARWAALCPDRKRVAYIARNDDESAALIVASVEDSAEPRELLSRPGLWGAPSWSPDGATLALTARNENEPGLWLIDVDSGETQRLGNGILHYHAWRPVPKD